MQNPQITPSRAVFLVCAIAGPMCSTGVSLARGQVPAESYLRARVAELYQAEEAREWRTWYQLLSPQTREETSYKEFVSEAEQRSYELLSWRIKRIRREAAELPRGYEAIAAVRMQVKVQETTGALKTASDQTDYWALIDGEWYWTWRGWPDD